MENLIAFGRVFLSYGLLLVIASALVVAAVWIGIRLRKRKNEKDGYAEAKEPEEESWRDTIERK